MQFASRDFISILSAMVSRLLGTQSQLTDFNIGSVTRALLEAPASELESLYVEYVNGLLDAIPTAIYSGFGFARLPAKYASGMVAFTKQPGYAELITIPRGTLVSVPGTAKVYVTDEPVSIAPDYEIALVRVTATVAGQAGNTLAGSIGSLGSSIPGVAAVTNSAAISSGRDIESDTERFARFVAYIDSLARGSVAALQYAARRAVIQDANGAILEYVARVGVEESAPGLVNLWVYGSGGPVSDALLTAVVNLVDGYVDRNAVTVPGYRAAGVQVVVRRMRTLAVAVEITAHPKPGYILNATMTADLQSAAAEYFASVEPGGIVATSLLVAQLLRADGVLSVDLTLPAQNVVVPFDSVPILGELTVL